MIVKGFKGEKLILTKKRVKDKSGSDYDELALKHGNKVLCIMYVGNDFINIFRSCSLRDTFVGLDSDYVKVGGKLVI